MNPKKFFAVLAMVFIALAALAGPASANTGSDGPTPYTVNASGVTLPSGQTFKANGHVNIKYKINGNSQEKSAGIHFDPNNNQPGGFWIGKNNIPWSGFGLKGQFCVTWVQVDGFNQHFGEGGQAPLCVGGDQDPTPAPDSKPVTLCHATGSDSNPYIGKTIPVSAWYNGHRDHQNNEDIWDAFSYKNVDGTVINVPARGNVELLKHPNCQPPAEDVKVVPTYTKVDKCETEDDGVSLVAGTGYTGSVTKNGLVYTVTAETTEGFVFNAAQMSGWTLSNGNHTAVTTVTLTDVDCDLPETGGEAQYNTTLGLLALGGVFILGAGGFVLARKKS